MSRQLSQNERYQAETALPDIREVPKLRLMPKELSAYESGLLIFKIIDGDMSQVDCYLEVIMDDNVFPAYTSAKTRSRQYTFNETGDAMIRELDLSKITLRLVAKEDKRGEGGNDESVKAKLTGDTMAILKQALVCMTRMP